MEARHHAGVPAEIRPSRRGDGEAVAKVHERCWRISYAGIADPSWVTDRPLAERAAEWSRYAGGAGVPMWVADDAGDVVGEIAAGQTRDDDAPAGTGEVVAMYVDPDRQREGIGRALMARALEELRAAGFTRVTLWTLGESAQSTAFYEALGFRRDGAVRRGERFAAHTVRYAREL